MYMRKELEGARYSNSALLDNNSNLQVEIDSLNNHIRVILTKMRSSLKNLINSFKQMKPLDKDLTAKLEYKKLEPEMTNSFNIRCIKYTKVNLQ